MTALPCPCGSRISYRECCRVFLGGEALAPTAESLMRSRYTAYVRRDSAYLLKTWHPSTRPDGIELDDTVWLGLEVLASREGGSSDATGVVEFEARYQGADGVVASLTEASRFVREGGAWLYVDGAAPAKAPPRRHR